MLTRDRSQMDPARKSDRIGLMFKWDQFGTIPKQIQMDPHATGPANFLSIWIRTGPVPNGSM